MHCTSERPQILYHSLQTTVTTINTVTVACDFFNTSIYFASYNLWQWTGSQQGIVFIKKYTASGFLFKCNHRWKRQSCPADRVFSACMAMVENDL